MNNWFLKIITSQANFLSSIGVSPEVIEWVMSQPDPKGYVNIIRQNPSITINELQQHKPQEKKSPYTQRELSRVSHFGEPFRTWALVQLKKLRTKPIQIPIRSQLSDKPKFLNDYEYKEALASFDRHMSFIYDWWGFSQPTPDIASYSYEQAKIIQEQWHNTQAGKGEGLFYEPTRQENIVYMPKEWNGWNIQKVISRNDLLVEGNLMNHCVGGYCRDGESLADSDTEIFSLRDDRNKPHVTIEIYGNYSIQQVQGNSNSTPENKYAKMIEEWFAQLKKERPELEMASNDDNYLDTIYNTERSRLDEVIGQIAREKELRQYGLQTNSGSIADIDIEKVYDHIVDVHKGNRSDDVSNVYYLAKALVNLAIESDKIRWENCKKIKTENGELLNEQSAYKEFQKLSQKYGLYQLDGIVDESFEKFDKEYDLYGDHGLREEDFETEDDYLAAVDDVEGEYQRDLRSQNLPYALDDELMDCINKEKKSNPFLIEMDNLQKRLKEQTLQEIENAKQETAIPQTVQAQKMNWLTKLAKRRFNIGDRVRYFVSPRKGTGKGIVLTPTFHRGIIQNFDPNTRLYTIMQEDGQTNVYHPRNIMLER